MYNDVQRETCILDYPEAARSIFCFARSYRKGLLLFHCNRYSIVVALAWLKDEHNVLPSCLGLLYTLAMLSRATN